MDSSLAVVSWIALKSTLVLTVAALVTATMHRRSAAARHVVWALALGSTLVLPVMSVVVPVWRVAIPQALMPMSGANDPVSVDVPHAADVNPSSATQPRALARQPLQAVVRASSPRPTSWSDSSWDASLVSWPAIALFVWLAGMLIAVAHLTLGAVTAHRLLRRATVITDERWASLFSHTKAQLWLHRHVVLVQSERVTTPATWGISHPVVVVPASADDWSDVQRHAVLLHELAHVERWDCLTHVVAQLACAVNWFNPLAWFAKHRLNTERERACDDRALGQVTRPSSYAEQLMTIAYSYQGRHRQPVGSLAMAKPSQLEDRVRRILDRALQRGGNTRSTTVRFGAITACFVVSIAAVHPHVARELNMAQQMMKHGAATTPADTLASGTNDVRWSGTLSPGDTIAIRNLVGDIRAEPTQGSQIVVVAQRHSTRDDPRTVQIHIERHDHNIVLCSVYPQQRSKNCDSYDFNNHGDDERGCGGGHEPCGSDVKVDWVVRVPANIRLSASTVAGNITATGLLNDIAAKSVGGNVDVSTAGHVTAWSMSRVNVAMGRTDWSGDLHLYAGSGLTVTLPSNAQTRVEANSTFGKLQSDFPLQQENRTGFGTRASGTLGHGGRTLQLNTLGGQIDIRNAAVAHVAEITDDTSAHHRAARPRSMAHRNADSTDSLRYDSWPYVTIDHAKIDATVRDAIDKANIEGTIAASIKAADIPGTVAKAMKAARIGQTVDSAMRSARIGEKIDAAMRVAFGDSTSHRSRPRDK